MAARRAQVFLVQLLCLGGILLTAADHVLGQGHTREVEPIAAQRSVVHDSVEFAATNAVRIGVSRSGFLAMFRRRNSTISRTSVT